MVQIGASLPAEWDCTENEIPSLSLHAKKGVTILRECNMVILTLIVQRRLKMKLSYLPREVGNVIDSHR